MARKTRKTRGKSASARIIPDTVAANVNTTANAETNFKRSVLSSLEENIAKYGAALVADSWKGGGDPGNNPIIEAELALARARVDRDMLEVRRLLFNSPNLT